MTEIPKPVRFEGFFAVDNYVILFGTPEMPLMPRA